MNTTNIERYAAKTLSALTFPLLLPSYAVILAFTTTFLWYLPVKPLFTVTLVTVGLTVMIPVIAIYFLHYTGNISDPMLNERRDRTIPYTLSILCYLGTAWYFRAVGTPVWMSTFMIAAAAVLLLLIFINLRWKISGHSAGMGGLTALGVYLVYMGYSRFEGLAMPAVLIVLSGAVMTARLILGRHTLAQVVAGYFLSFTIILGAVLFVL